MNGTVACKADNLSDHPTAVPYPSHLKQSSHVLTDFTFHFNVTSPKKHAFPTKLIDEET